MWKWKRCNLRGLEDENSRKTRIIAFRYTTNLGILLLPRSAETTFLKFLFSTEDKNLFFGCKLSLCMFLQTVQEIVKCL